jgi:4-hydroxybenzoate-CoA ligase
MLEDLLRRKPYNAAADFVDAPVARGFGKKIAFIDPDRSLTYAELQERTCRFAAALQSLGLRPEERLALLIYDNVDFPVAFWGGIRAGNVVLPLNTLLTAEQYPTFWSTAAPRLWWSPRRLPRRSFRFSIGCRACAPSY